MIISDGILDNYSYDLYIDLVFIINVNFRIDWSFCVWFTEMHFYLFERLTILFCTIDDEMIY
jgi:hypothetical protein